MMSLVIILGLLCCGGPLLIAGLFLVGMAINLGGGRITTKF